MNKITLELNKFSKNSQTLLELQLKHYFNDLSYNEVRAIEVINDYPNTNMAGIAHKLHLTRAGASKLLKKLESLGFIEKQAGSNRKELYYVLTTLGQETNNNHINLHKSWEDLEQKMYSQISAEDQETVLNFMLLANKLSKAEAEKFKK